MKKVDLIRCITIASTPTSGLVALEMVFEKS